MSVMMDEVLQKIVDIAKEAGEILLGAREIDGSVEAKSGKANFVTAYDKRVQDFLFGRLAQVLPEAVFIGEEEETHAALPEGYAFIVDPIDGTTNFMKGYCTSSISIGLLRAGNPELGVVYNPYLREVFHAVKGKGAFRNGIPIHVSEHGIEEGIVIFGTAPYYEELAEKSFRYVYRLFRQCLDVRRSGSSAIDVCNVACGRAELFFELMLSPWDYAASSLILMEAGGVIADAQGGALTYDGMHGVVAGNEKNVRIFEEIRRELS